MIISTNRTINFSRLNDTVQQHDLNVSRRIRKLASKYILVNRKKKGEVYQSLSFTTKGFFGIFFRPTNCCSLSMSEVRGRWDGEV